MNDLKKKLAAALEENSDKPRQTHKKSAASTTMIINGDGNVQVNGNMNINSKKIERVPPPPRGPEHITDLQAYKLMELVKKAVEIESKAGKEPSKAFPAWWSKLKKKYKVPRYDLIPCNLGDEAISYMQQEIAKLRPKLRRRDNEAWRNEHYRGIWSRSKELGHDKPWVYALVEEKIGKKIESLTTLGEQDLKKLYTIVMSI